MIDCSQDMANLKLLYVIYWYVLYLISPWPSWKPAGYSCRCFCLSVQNVRTSDWSSNHWQVVNKMMRPGGFQDKAQEMKQDLQNRDCRFYWEMLKELGEIFFEIHWNPSMLMIWIVWCHRSLLLLVESPRWKAWGFQNFQILWIVVLSKGVKTKLFHHFFHPKFPLPKNSGISICISMHESILSQAADVVLETIKKWSSKLGGA